MTAAALASAAHAGKAAAFDPGPRPACGRIPAVDPPDQPRTSHGLPAILGPARSGTAMTFHTYRAQWLGNLRGDLLSGLVVALALIPEAIAFSIIAGVDPKVGLYASFSIAVVTAIAGGRPSRASSPRVPTSVAWRRICRRMSEAR